jgi:hypothetical protein
MIETLYTNGCSWTFGSELEQDSKFKDYLAEQNLHLEDPDDELNWNLLDNNNQIVSRLDLHYNKFNWSGTLKNRVGAKFLKNDSFGGGSNHRILRTTLNYIRQLDPAEYKKTLVVIGWTASERNEIFVGGGWHRWNLNHPFNNDVDRLLVTDEQYIAQLDKFQQDYIGLVYNDYVNIKTYFDSVYLLSNTLSNLRIKHFFFNALPPWWEGGEYKTDCDVNKHFANELKWHESHSNIENFRDSFMLYVNRKKYVLAKNLHPLCDAHTDWANYIYNEMTVRGIL